jgi:hypothetical protein
MHININKIYSAQFYFDPECDRPHPLKQAASPSLLERIKNLFASLFKDASPMPFAGKLTQQDRMTELYSIKRINDPNEENIDYLKDCSHQLKRGIKSTLIQLNTHLSELRANGASTHHTDLLQQKISELEFSLPTARLVAAHYSNRSWEAYALPGDSGFANEQDLRRYVPILIAKIRMLDEIHASFPLAF